MAPGSRCFGENPQMEDLFPLVSLPEAEPELRLHLCEMESKCVLTTSSLAEEKFVFID